MPARMPGILLAATQTPTPEPQMRMPRGASPRLDGIADLLGKVGIVVRRFQAVVGTQIDDFMACLGEIGADILLERKPGVIGADD
jgi:hypothetical protein